MINKRIQNKVAESKLSLPLALIYGILVFLVCWLGVQHGNLLSFAFLGVTTFLLMLLNNTYALIRIFSRMVSCSFLFLSAMLLALPPRGSASEPATLLLDVPWGADLVQVCFIVFFILLFSTYQNKNAVGQVFTAFFCLGMASMAFPHIVFMLPMCWFLLAVYMLAMSVKTFLASLFGFSVPYWFLSAYSVYTGRFMLVPHHFETIAVFGQVGNVASLGLNRVAMLCWVVLLALTGAVHFLRYSYQDKIRTRMEYEAFMLTVFVITLFLVLQPQHFDTLMRLLMVVTAPLVGHFIALTHSKLSNISFLFMVLATLLLTAFNLWMPSFSF